MILELLIVRVPDTLVCALSRYLYQGDSWLKQIMLP
jgi:hypothetical protein